MFSSCKTTMLLMLRHSKIIDTDGWSGGQSWQTSEEWTVEISARVSRQSLHFRPPSNENTNACTFSTVALFQTLCCMERRYRTECCSASDLLLIHFVSLFIIGLSCLGTFQCTLFENGMLMTRRNTSLTQTVHDKLSAPFSCVKV